MYWVTVGAQPTDTVRTILSNEGVLMMNHLNGGVKKGAFDQAEAERRFNEWKAKKDAKTNAVKSSMADQRELSAKQRLKPKPPRTRPRLKL